jgi:histone-lysine N-methyltransferase SETD2
MGIFAERKVKAGEELVFNYNVDRYGADPQPCYCGEPNCTGYIGGKTQTERATKLSLTVIEALGIDDGDGWDTAVAKRPRKKRANEDDEEYVNNVQPRPLDEDGVTKVMASLLQNKEKWITVKLLDRIDQSDDEKIIHRVVRMHGYQILKSVLAAWKEDVNIILQIFNILDKFPRLTKNKITDSNIEGTVEELLAYEDEAVQSRAKTLLDAWSQLETAYRIPRKKRDPNAPTEAQARSDWREARNDKGRRSRSRSRSRSKSPPRGPAIPSGPRSNHAQRQFFPNSRPPFRQPRPFSALPDGWFAASSNGRTYYYTSAGETQWKRPTVPANRPAPPPPPKAVNATKKLDDLINEITSAKTKTPDKSSSAGTPQAAVEEPKPEKKSGQEKWRSYSEEKQKKIYENTVRSILILKVLGTNQP